MTKILIVEDDVNLGSTLSGAFEMQNFLVRYLSSGDSVMEELTAFNPDILLLDVILNGKLDGFEIAKQIRDNCYVPIIFTTSCDGNEDFKKGFGIENTDYIRKPYRLMEVLLRVNSLLSKQKQAGVSHHTYKIGDYCFFSAEQTLKSGCKNIHLNNYESAVLTLLCKNIETFISKKDIIELIWHEKDTTIKEGSLNNVLSTLRKHFSDDEHILLEGRIKLGVKLSITEQ